MDWTMVAAGAVITALMIIAEHLAERFFRVPRESVRWYLVRVTAGCLAILAGLAFVLPITWLFWVFLFMAWAGTMTALCYGVVELWILWQGRGL